jgi:hypothetical protein
MANLRSLALAALFAAQALATDHVLTPQRLEDDILVDE